MSRINGGDGLKRLLGKHGGVPRGVGEKVAGSREIHSEWRCGRGTWISWLVPVILPWRRLAHSTLGHRFAEGWKNGINPFSSGQWLKKAYFVSPAG